MKKGFNRLRGVAAASAMGLGLLGAGSARASNVSIPVANLTRGSAVWKVIGNNSSLFSGTSAAISTPSGFSYAPTTTTSSSSAFAIADVSAEGFAEAFDNALHLAVDGTLFVNPDATVDLTSDTITSDTQALAGLDTSIQYYFHPTRPIVRAMYSFTNTGGSGKTINALIAGTLASDGNTTIQATSTGETKGLLNIPDTDDSNDLWRITNDQKGIGINSSTDPAITMSRFGSGAATVPDSVLLPGSGTFGSGDLNNFGERYNFTVPANSTARILVFVELNKTISDAENCAVDFASLDAAFTAGMLDGLSVAQIDEVINYGALGTVTAPATTCGKNAAITPTDPGTGTGSTEDEKTGALNLAGLGALLGLLTLVRVRRSKNS
ncbi:MAG: hypothetical protein DRQ44_09045 [Gammaproteobacteria bacterium]|nr:MAG: hypothetical protein DRQ44_09045 [Gammaproteobacteria bacterium]